MNEGRRRVLDPVERVSEVLFGHADDVRGAIEVFLLVFCSTLPVVVPFVLFDAVPRAMRVSNAVAVVMLGVGGYSLGRYGGLRPWRTAAAMTGLGLVLVALTMALGE